MLKLNNVSVSYASKKVIDDLTCHFKEGDITTIIGPNGCGKSTLLKAVAKSKKIDNGNIMVKGKNIAKIKHKDFAKMISILPQNPQAPFDLTVRQLITLGRNPHLNWRSRITEKDVSIVDDVISKTNLVDMQHKYLQHMSGGERQRAWLAMTFAQEPKLLLLDEPTTYLDINYQYEVLELIKRLNKKTRLTIIMVLHNINQAARYADNIVVMKNGRLKAVGPPTEVINEQILKEVFRINAKVVTDECNRCPLFIPITE